MKVINLQRGTAAAVALGGKKPPRCISCSRYDGFLGCSQSFNMHDSHVLGAPLRIFQAIFSARPLHGIGVSRKKSVKTAVCLGRI
jgi:hypothetical protein